MCFMVLCKVFYLNDLFLITQLKQKTVELTQACQKHYELEQELAFHKIDVKFEPLPFYPDPVSFVFV